MPFFVVQRNADAGLSIPLPESYPTREAAIAALSSAAADGSVVLTGEVFIADLDAAVPVLVMQPAIAPAAAAESSTEAELAEEEAPLLDEAVAESAYAEWTPLSGLTDDASLAAALKRAASSLEEEGIVAPASIESGPEEDDEAAAVSDEVQPTEESSSWPWANVDAYGGEGEEPEAPAEVTEDNAEASPGAEPVEELVEESAAVVAEAVVPDTIAEPLGVSAELREDESTAEEVVPLVDVPVGEDLPIITSAPVEGEEAYLPRPVILGDYADSSATSLVDEPEEPEEPAAAFGGLIAEPIESPTNEAADIGYEAGGDLDLAGYTCQDCVYANTCPKVGQASPANCGSFQWRAE